MKPIDSESERDSNSCWKYNLCCECNDSDCDCIDESYTQDSTKKDDN